MNNFKRICIKTYSIILVLFVCVKASATIFPAGSVIIDMGNATPTVANTMKGYGLVYSLLKWKSVPINCIINAGKAKDGIDFTATTTVYPSLLTPTSRSFYAGCYVISAEYITAAVKTTLDSAQATKWGGVAKYYISTAIDLPVSYTLKYAPRWVVNNANQAITYSFFDAAGIPNSTDPGTATSEKAPSTLGACDDIFVMPHSDPTWATHQNLRAWNDTYNGAIWAGCHAVSVFENLSNGAGDVGGTTYMNFLTTVPSPLATISNSSNNRGLRHYNEDPLGNHGDGSTSSGNLFSTAYPTDPVYQYRGVTDGAQENGSEQIYFPKRNSNWNPGAKVGVWDPTPPTALDGIYPGSGSNRSGGVGAKAVYGRGFDDVNRGYVCYESGHDISGTGTDNVNAMRIFFNFSFFAGVDKVAITAAYAGFTAAPPNTIVQGTTSGTLSINGGVALPVGYTVKWTSSVAGGSFSNSTSVSTTYTAPTNVSCLQQDIITVTVTDPCGRTAFDSKGVSLITSTPPVITPPSQLTFCPGGNAALITTTYATGNQWYKDGVAIGGATGQNYSATASGVYTVINTNSGTGCSTPESAGVTVLVSCFSVSGIVWIDANGNAIKAGGEVNYTAGGLNAILVDASNKVAESVAVDALGVYTLTKFPQSLTGYKIIISTTAGTVGNAPPAIVLPAGANGYVTTGENNNGTPETGVNADGTILLPSTVAPIPNLNFGINQRPLGFVYNGVSMANPGGTNTVLVPSAAFTGSDPEDASGGYPVGLSGRKVRLSPATNATLYYNGVAVNSATDFPAFDPALVRIDPTGNGVVNTSFNYQVYDNAGVASLVKAINLPFFDLTLTGKVWDDADGTTNGVIDGTGIGSPASSKPITQLYVNLVVGSNVVGSVPVASNGTYTLGNANGTTTNTTFSLVLSTTQGTPGNPVASVLPSGWVHTAQTTGGGDGTAIDGLLSIAVVTSVINTGLDFGIEQLPTAGSGITSNVVNPGGTISVTVPAATFTNTTVSSDIAPGTVSGIRITSFPTNTTSITINGVTYQSSVPADVVALLALVIPTNGSGSPSWAISLDPNFVGSGSSVISFKAVDNAGKPSLNTGTATINFTGFVSLRVKVLLEGATLGNGPGFESIMRDNLRTSPFTAARYIPNSDPYSTIAQYSALFTRVGDGTNPALQTVITPATMFASRGTTSAVDWIFIELRDKNNPATVLATRSAIVQRDGTVVDIDGSSCITFPNQLIDNYYVAVRHRNHMGAMTAAPVLSATLNCSSVVDFTTMTAAQLWNQPGYDGLEMQTLSDGKRALWAGNANGDKKIKYTAPDDDLFQVFVDELLHPDNASFDYNFDFGYGYIAGDVDMNSKVKYTAPDDDAFLVFVQLLLYSLNAGFDYNYDFFVEQLP